MKDLLNKNRYKSMERGERQRVRERERRKYF
jgi:hypothetical protein